VPRAEKGSAMTDGSALRRRAGWWRAIYACAALTIAMTAHHGAAQSTKSLEQIENDEKLKRAIEPINDAESKLHAMLRRREVDCARAIGFAPFCDCVMKDLPIAWNFSEYVMITTRSKDENGYTTMGKDLQRAYDNVAPIRDRCVKAINVER